MVDNILVTVEEVLCPEDRHEDVPAGGVLRYPRDPLGGGAQPEGDLSAGVARGHGDVTQCQIRSLSVLLHSYPCSRSPVAGGRCYHHEGLSLTEIHLWPPGARLSAARVKRQVSPPATHPTPDTGAASITGYLAHLNS